MPSTALETARAAAAAPPVHEPRELSYLRLVAQGLVPATAAPTPVEAVRRQLAIQGQQVSAIPHAVLARTPRAVTRADVDAAFEESALVRSWPMRGTVHVTTAEDHHWMREALVHRLQGWMRVDEERFGHGSDGLARAADAAREALTAAAGEGRPGLTRAELFEVWETDGILPELIASGMPETYAKRHLVVALHATGHLVQGPRRGNEHLIVSAEELPPASSGPGGAVGTAHGAEGHRAAVAEIARRYATSHGPVSAADLSRWTTLPATECRRALEDAVELTNAADYAADAGHAHAPLTRYRAEGGLRGTVTVLGAGADVAPRGRAVADVLYGRADLPDLLAASRKQAEATLYLGAFDELHVGYKDRLSLTDAAGELLICPSMNGMFRPLLVDHGRVVAVRPAGSEPLWASDARVSARLEKDVDRAVARMERRLAR